MNSHLIRPIKFELMQTGGRVGGQMLQHLRTPNPVLDLDGATKGYVDSLSPPPGTTVDSVQKPYKPTAALGWHAGMTRTIGTAFPVIRGITYIVPLFAGNQTLTWTHIGIRIHAGGAGSSVRLGVAQLDHTSDLTPVALLQDAGTLPTTTAGIKTKALPTNLTTTARMLGLAIQAEDSDTPPTVRGTGNTMPNFFPPWFGFSEPSPDSIHSLVLVSNTIVADGTFDLDATHYYSRVDRLSPMAFIKHSSL